MLFIHQVQSNKSTAVRLFFYTIRGAWSDFHGPRGLLNLRRFGPNCLLKFRRLGPSCLGPTFYGPSCPGPTCLWAELSVIRPIILERTIVYFDVIDVAWVNVFIEV